MAYRLSGGTVTYFAGRKRHYSFYTVTAHLVEAFQEEVAAHESPVACATLWWLCGLQDPIAVGRLR